MIDPYGSILRGVVLPLGDRWRGIPIGNTLRFLNQSQYWSRDKLEAYRNAKLRHLVESSMQHVPHYRETLGAMGVVPTDIKVSGDLVGLPVLTRSILREHNTRHFLNEGVDLSRTATVRTGGSTGQPLSFHVPGNCRAFDRATLYRLYHWCGVKRGDPVFSVWGHPPATRDRGQDKQWRQLKRRFISRTRSLDAFSLSSRAQQQFLQLMQGGERKIMRGYTSALVSLARFAIEQDLPIPQLTALVTTAEPLYAQQRAVLSNAFAAPVHDQYGCAEVNGVAMQCEVQDGLHISEEHVIVEILDDNDRPVRAGAQGRIVLTNLDNKAMPFLRYDTGDRGALRTGNCDCGRNLALMDPVQGRQVDVIAGLNGQRVYGTFFYQSLAGLGWFDTLPMSAFQVTQTATDHLDMALVCTRLPDDGERQRLLDLVRSHLGPVSITLRKVNAVAHSPGGKLRYVIGLPEGGDPSGVAPSPGALS